MVSTTGEIEKQHEAFGLSSCLKGGGIDFDERLREEPSKSLEQVKSC